MATIVFSKPVPFPIAPLIAGRSDRSVIFVETRAHVGAAPQPAPPHAWHLKVGSPTTDLVAIADRVLLLVCMVSMVPDEDEAHCQLTDGGSWLTAADLLRLFKLVLAGEPLSVGAGLGKPASAFAASRIPERMPGRDARYADLPPDRAGMLAGMDETLARLLHAKGMGGIADGMGLVAPPAYAHETPRPDALPTLVMLSTAPLFLDWLKIEEGLTAIDPAGGWSVQPDGPHGGTARGRGATITIACEATPLPAYLLAQGMAREHFLRPEQRERLASHRCRQTIRVALDTRAAPFVDVRQAAKAAAMLIAPAATLPAFVGLFNAGTGVATPADRVRDSIGALAADEVPIAIWTWVATDSVVADAVSLSTAGMRPFIGYEVECWNAPGELTAVAERLYGVMRYLLINGPVINHGDTIGDTAGDRSTRCFLGDSKAQRGGDEPVPAMLLEFDGDRAGDGRDPRPDLPVRPAPAADPVRAALGAPPAPTLTAFVVLTKPVGLAATDLLRELDDRLQPWRWTLDDSDRGLQAPRLLTGSGPAGTVTVRITGETTPLAEAGVPPHRLHLRVEIACGDDRALAGRIAAVVCCCLPVFQDPQAHARLSPACRWLGVDALMTAMSMAKLARSMATIAPDPDGPTPVRPTPQPHPAPAPLRRAGGFGRKGL